MPRSTTLTVIVALIVILSSVAGVYYYLKTSSSEGEQGSLLEPEGSVLPRASYAGSSLTMPLPENVTLIFKSVMTTYNETIGPINRNATNATVTILGYGSWPFVNVTTSVGGEPSGSASMLPFPHLELPREWLGKDRLTLPLSIPFLGEGLCIELHLTGQTDGNYTYEGEASVQVFIVRATLVYGSDGIIREALFHLTSTTPIGGVEINVSHKLVLQKINGSTGTGVSVKVPENWTCSPPLSSHLWFTWEGIYKLSQCRIEPVSVNELLAAMNGESVVFYLNKGCPHCIRDWPDIVTALDSVCKSASDKVYLIIIGSMMNETVYNYLTLTMSQNGVTGYPAIVYFKGGFAADKIMGERTAEEIASFIRASLNLAEEKR